MKPEVERTKMKPTHNTGPSISPATPPHPVPLPGGEREQQPLPLTGTLSLSPSKLG
jgi:hypothetical protein